MWCNSVLGRWIEILLNLPVDITLFRNRCCLLAFAEQHFSFHCIFLNSLKIVIENFAIALCFHQQFLLEENTDYRKQAFCIKYFDKIFSGTNQISKKKHKNSRKWVKWNLVTSHYTKHSLLAQNLVNTTNGDGRIFGHSEQVHEDSETLSSSGNSALANPPLKFI